MVRVYCRSVCVCVGVFVCVCVCREKDREKDRERRKVDRVGWWVGTLHNAETAVFLSLVKMVQVVATQNRQSSFRSLPS